MGVMTNIPEGFRPLLAAKTPEEHELHKLDGKWPLYGSPKYDGIRAVVLGGVVYSRTLKPIRNTYVQRTFGRPEFEGLDGELILGDPTAKGCFQATTSAVMTIGSETPVRFWVFDRITQGDFSSRFVGREKMEHPDLEWVPQVPLANWARVLEYEEQCLTQGYEGVMLRSPFGAYKFGRSTLREGHLIKVKRFEDGEAIVQDFVEKYYNRNEPIIDALGLQKRSSSIEGKVPAGVLGAFVVRDVTTGLVFEIGSGLDDYWRSEVWNNKEKYKGSIIKYKYQPYGVKELPRSPIFLGFRDPIDM